jgi:hypothetical protein
MKKIVCCKQELWIPVCFKCHLVHSHFSKFPGGGPPDPPPHCYTLRLMSNIIYCPHAHMYQKTNIIGNKYHDFNMSWEPPRAIIIFKNVLGDDPLPLYSHWTTGNRLYTVNALIIQTLKTKYIFRIWGCLNY